MRGEKKGSGEEEEEVSPRRISSALDTETQQDEEQQLEVSPRADGARTCRVLSEDRVYLTTSRVCSASTENEMAEKSVSHGASVNSDCHIRPRSQILIHKPSAARHTNTACRSLCC